MNKHAYAYLDSMWVSSVQLASVGSKGYAYNFGVSFHLVSNNTKNKVTLKTLPSLDSESVDIESARVAGSSSCHLL